jgi:hypothetical protein
VKSADGADKMVKGMSPRRSLPFANLIISHQILIQLLWMTAHRADLFVFASFDEAPGNGRYAGVR